LRKHLFWVIFVSSSTRFSALGPIFWKPPELSQNPCRWHFMRFLLIFGPLGPRSRPFMGHFVTFPNRQLLAQTQARMTYFITLTVLSPRTDHSLRHSTTRVGLQARRGRILFFRQHVRFGRFSVFGTRPIFWKPPGLSQNTCRWHFMRFWLILGP
jgi:hypothetical protein